MKKNYTDSIKSIEPTTIAGRLRESMPEIDRKLREGATFAQIIEALRNDGLEVKKGAITSALARYRKRRRTGSINPPPNEMQSATPDNNDNPAEDAPMPTGAEIRRMLTREWTAEEIADSEFRRSEKRRKARKVKPAAAVPKAAEEKPPEQPSEQTQPLRRAKEVPPEQTYDHWATQARLKKLGNKEAP